MAIDAKLVMKLREASGAGVLDSRKALEESAGDIEKAKTLLKQRGIDKALKKQDRATGVGRVGSYIHANGKVGALVELRCETDFVANNESFIDLLRDLCLHVAGATPVVVTREQLPQSVVDEAKKLYEKEMLGKPPEVAAKILDGKLGKNLYAQKVLLDQPFVNEAKYKGAVSELIKSRIAQFGENITIHRFTRFEA